MSTPAPVKQAAAATLKSLADFHACCAALGIEIPAEEPTVPSPLDAPAEVVINGKRPGNRVVIHPMEGWDGTLDGKPTEFTKNRWVKFAISGAKLLFGCEAVAVCHEGKAMSYLQPGWLRFGHRPRWRPAWRPRRCGQPASM